MSIILVPTEIRDGQLKSINFEVFTTARKLADETNMKAAALLLGEDVGSLTEIPGKYGIDQVLTVEDPKLGKLSPDCFAAAISEAAKQKDAKIILMGATNLGKDLMARVAFNLDTTLAQDIMDYKVDGDKVTFSK